MKLSSIACCILSVLSASASAEGLYGSVAMAQSFSSYCPAGNYSCQTTADAFDLGVGYHFTPVWGAEANLTKLGAYNAYGTTMIGNTDANALQLVGTGDFPVFKNTALIGRLGLARVSLTQQSALASSSANGVNVTYGIGFKHDFSSSVSVRVLWESLGSTGNADTGSSPVSLISTGIAFKL